MIVKVANLIMISCWTSLLINGWHHRVNHRPMSFCFYMILYLYIYLVYCYLVFWLTIIACFSGRNFDFLYPVVPQNMVYLYQILYLTHILYLPKHIFCMCFQHSLVVSPATLPPIIDLQVIVFSPPYYLIIMCRCACVVFIWYLMISGCSHDKGLGDSTLQ